MQVLIKAIDNIRTLLLAKEIDIYNTTNDQEGALQLIKQAFEEYCNTNDSELTQHKETLRLALLELSIVPIHKNKVDADLFTDCCLKIRNKIIPDDAKPLPVSDCQSIIDECIGDAKQVANRNNQQSQVIFYEPTFTPEQTTKKWEGRKYFYLNEVRNDQGAQHTSYCADKVIAICADTYRNPAMVNDKGHGRGVWITECVDKILDNMRTAPATTTQTSKGQSVTKVRAEVQNAACSSLKSLYEILHCITLHSKNTYPKSRIENIKKQIDRLTAGLIKSGAEIQDIKSSIKPELHRPKLSEQSIRIIQASPSHGVEWYTKKPTFIERFKQACMKNNRIAETRSSITLKRSISNLSTKNK